MQAPAARINEVTPMLATLESLPPPVEPVVVAVYKFRDQTGQYRPSENGSSFSTAVTQGATSILIKALDDSGYFSPIERENVSNLLNERKIIRSTRTQYGDPNATSESQLLPPLLYAGILIEGGIVSYDANVLTGGVGARYFGAGANARYRQDRITIYLRAVSTSNGRVLKTVNTSRTILSQALDGGIFRFVKFQRLLEAETGYTYNEPGEIAVREAIEKAVQVLVLEGLVDGLWFTADTTGGAVTQVEQLLSEQQTTEAADLRGPYGQAPRLPYQIGAFAQTTRYTGDFGQGRFEYGLGLSASYRPNPVYGFTLAANTGRLSTTDLRYQRNVIDVGGRFDVRPVPDFKLVPLLRFGLGATLETGEPGEFVVNEIVPNLYYGAGVEYQLAPSLELQALFGNTYHLTDQLDGERRGKFNDWILQGQIGLQYFFGKPSISERE